MFFYFIKSIFKQFFLDELVGSTLPIKLTKLFNRKISLIIIIIVVIIYMLDIFKGYEPLRSFSTSTLLLVLGQFKICVLTSFKNSLKTFDFSATFQVKSILFV